MRRWVCGVVVAWALGSALGGEKAVEVDVCAAGEYFDSSNFQCTSCGNPPNQGADRSNANKRVPDFSVLYQPFANRPNYLVPTGCTCAAGWIKDVADFNSTATCTNAWCQAFDCIQCGASNAATIDRQACLPCGPPVNDSATTSAPSVTNTGSPTNSPTVSPTRAPTTAEAGSIYFDASSSMCKCTVPGYAIRERDFFGNLLPYKVCQPCPKGSLLMSTYKQARIADGTLPATTQITESDNYKCFQCPHPAMTVYNNQCVCSLPGDLNPTWTQVGVEGVGKGVSCILTAEASAVNQQSAGVIEYSHVISVSSSDEAAQSALESGSRNRRLLRALQSRSSMYTSFTVKNSATLLGYYPAMGASCRYLRDAKSISSCQALANLCVLQEYDPGTDACTLLENIVRQRLPWTASSWKQWQVMTPWVMYDEQPSTVTSDLGIGLEFSFNMEAKPGTYDYLQFVLARYALNGEFLGFRNVTSEFEWCSLVINQVPVWRKFGFGYSRGYECNLLNVVQYFGEPEFYDLYVVDYANGGALYPVPVRNRNLRSSNGYPNDNQSPAQEANDILTRRFFLFDQVSSKSSALGQAQVIRFAKSISLTISAQGISANKIYPPVLEILYQDVLVSDLFALGVDELGNPPSAATTVPVSFSVSYTQDYTGFWRTASALFATTMTAVGLFALLRLHNWTKRNSRLPGDAQVDLVYLMRGLSYLMSTFSSVFFWFLFAYSAYFFIFFKMQDNVQLLLPENRPQYGSANDYYPFIVMLQVCFFGQVFRMLEIVIGQTRVDVFFLDWEKPRGRVTAKRGDGTKTKFAPVSIWRTLFMVNEFAELQRERKYDVNFAFLLLATLLVGADLQYAAVPTPTLATPGEGEKNIVLSFFNTCFWFLVISYGEILWRWAVQDRFITEPPTQSFIDLATMAKTSVFILDEEYHGYYLHCRSQHEFADVSMLEISRHLQQEQQGLTTDRGLPGAPNKGLQSFEIYVTGEWKRQYNVIYKSMMNEEQGAGAGSEVGLFDKLRGKSGRPSSEKLVKAARRLNAFLRAFVDQENADFPIAHREQSFIHRFLHTPPEMINSKENLFFPDTFYDYDRVLFYGQTWNLILFNLLCLGTFELWWGNSMLSIFLAFLADRLFEVLRDNLGKANLSAKTLVDDRFMI